MSAAEKWGLRRTVRLALALLVLVAIGSQLVLHIAGGFSVLNFFSYFTNLSNLFAAVVLLLSAFAPADRPRDLARYAATVQMLIVGVVFAVLLRDVDLGALRPWVNIVLHYVMPVAVVLDWLLHPPARRLGRGAIAIVLVFPTLYLAYTLLRGAAIGWYPYPFLNPVHAGGVAGVAVYAVGIAVVFLLAGVVLRGLGNHLRAMRAGRAPG